MTITRNPAKNGIELHFDEKPAPETLTAMKSAGFRWQAKSQMWYAVQSTETLALAEALEIGEPLNSPVAKAPAAPKSAYEMVYTFGGYRDKNGLYTACHYSLCDNYIGGAHVLQIEVSTSKYGDIPLPAGGKLENNSDSMCDYFEHSRWFISPDAPDFLGVLAAYEKQEIHQKKRSEKLEARHGGGVTREERVAYLRRLMGYSQEKAQESIDREDENRREKERKQAAYVSTVRALAEAFQKARAAGDPAALKAAENQMNSAVSDRQGEARRQEGETARAVNLRVVKTAQARGKCVQMEGVAFLQEETVYRLLSAGTTQQVFSLTAIDTATGERLFSGEFPKKEERQAKIIEILKRRRIT